MRSNWDWDNYMIFKEFGGAKNRKTWNVDWKNNDLVKAFDKVIFENSFQFEKERPDSLESSESELSLSSNGVWPVDDDPGDDDKLVLVLQLKTQI